MSPKIGGSTTKQKLLKVYIPTRGRIGYMNQVTLRQFLEYSNHKPTLVCPKSEVKRHKKYWKNVIGCPVLGIGNTRQWILENSKADIVVMADDDLRFSYRKEPSITKLDKCEDLQILLDDIRDYSKYYIHGGLSARQGNNFFDGRTERLGLLVDPGHGLRPHYAVECFRSNNFHFMCRREVLNLGAKMNSLEVMEDFYFTLYLLLKGYKNIIFLDYTWNQGASGSEGGCSLYRTAKVQDRSARAFKKAFPNFVSLVTKKSKGSSNYWKDFKVRTDVRVQWIKAYRYSLQTKV